MKRRSSRSPDLDLLTSAGLAAVILLVIVLAGSLSSCAAPEIEAEALPEPRRDAEVVPEPVPAPFVTEWAGTTWIYRDVPEGSREFPGYRGFHLGRDGRLLLINLDDAVGNTWSADGNRLRMDLVEGVPSLPIEGFFLALEPQDPKGSDGRSGTGPERMRLVPEALRDSEGIVLERAKVNMDVIENHWIPRAFEGGDTVMWPMNREIHLMLLPDASGGMGILGYGGENRFRGGIDLGVDRFVTGPIAITRRFGPASDFEDLYVRRIGEADRYVQVDDDLFLYAETRPKAAFRVRLFD